tara:strand:+ start:16014 stop:17255 length:1242 start_codon:yes stop_codon:yes gene_type:complete
MTNKVVGNCRHCEAELFSVIDFGKMPIANAFLNIEEFKNEYFFNLEASICSSCKLFQLVEQPLPEMLFHENYAFFAETSNVMQEHFKDLSEELISRFDLNKQDLVVEIGNNDGGMVYYLSKNNYNCIGIDPSKNVSDRAEARGVMMINDFFNQECANTIAKKYGSARFFLSCNTLAHIPDINSVFEGISNLLSQEGVYITEDPYLCDVLKKISYDQIYDEHVFIFSLTAMVNICSKFGLEVFDIKKINTAGGSMRYYIAKKGTHKISKTVAEQISFENNLFQNNTVYKIFRESCLNSKEQLSNLLYKIAADNKIVGYGATSKSTTIFNFCNIDNKAISYLTDTTKTKIGKFTPGSHIPIYDYQYFQNNLPDYCFLLAWNHANEIFKKEKNFFSKNGKWIIHTPEVKVLDENKF